MPEKRSNNQEDDDISLFLEGRGYSVIPIVENATGLLLITVKVNGVTGLFILDTGAGISLVESGFAERLKLKLKIEDTSYTGAGAGGQGLKVIPSKGNKIEIGDYTVTDFTISTMSLEHMNQALGALGATEVVLGIIGVDILKPAKAIIDYSSMTLYLSTAV